MNRMKTDFILTVDGFMCYYGGRKNYEDRNWRELTGPVKWDDLVDPNDCDELNSIYFVSKRKKKTPYVDPEFFKKFKTDE